MFNYHLISPSICAGSETEPHCSQVSVYSPPNEDAGRLCTAVYVCVGYAPVGLAVWVSFIFNDLICVDKQ